ncbi:MAG: hypothetical protein IJ745_03000 [Bacteroidales bacterium]|nr:hypothetical protein [Bacteroidales bacterium]
MNRLQHFLRAKTQFNLHSPFVYGLYTEVLFSRAGGAPKGRFEEVVWRLERHYGVEASRLGSTATLRTSDGNFLVVDHPHRDETRWQSFVDNPRFQATIDLFSVGLAVQNPRLSKQHFILR